MEVVRLENSQKEQYSNFVTAQKCGSFLQSWSWGDWQTTLGHSAIRYAVFDDNKNIIASVQLLQTKIPHMPGSYIYAPYGPLVSIDVNTEEILSLLLVKLKNDFSNCWFIRLEPNQQLSIDGKLTLHIQPGSSLITDLTSSEEDLLGAMHQKTRYNIKVAAKHGLKVSTTNTETVDQALSLLANTSKRQGYKSHPVAYYKKLLAQLSSQNKGDCVASLYQVLYENKCIAAAIILDSGATRTYLFGGSDNNYRNLMAPYALHWQVILDAKKNGLKNYDWWGTETASGSAPGFVQFKLRWGGVQKFYPEARDIVLNGKWYLAYKTLRKVNRLF